ncbi:hypothetical protein AQB9606_00370 [Aquabacterium sp. CECT 9606]|nr:hypothetical protein AQB9606_00370 [Aquabacterium sp. CECT 9606]
MSLIKRTKDFPLQIFRGIKGPLLFTLGAAMRNMCKMHLSKLFTILLFGHMNGFAYTCAENQDLSAPIERRNYQESKINFDGNLYILRFNKKNAQTTLFFKGGHQLVDDVPINKSPLLVDSAMWVRLLPLEKQPYLKNGIIALTLARKSKVDSTGQCGAGREVDLVFFKASKSRVKKLSRYVLESCLDSVSIALDAAHMLDAISVENGELVGDYDDISGEQGLKKKFLP